MKKLSQLFRMISARFTVEDQQEQIPFQRVQPGWGNNCPEDAAQQNNSRYTAAEPAADAARKLWCRAQHF